MSAQLCQIGHIIANTVAVVLVNFGALAAQLLVHH